MKTNSPLWIGSVEAAELSGLSEQELRRKVYAGDLKVRYSKLSRKAKIKYSRTDIEAELNQRMTA